MRPDLPIRELRRSVTRALDEDIAQGDVTSLAVVPPGAEGSAVLVARVPMVACGLDVFREVFAQVDAAVRVDGPAEDGSRWTGGDDALLTVHGPLRSILTAERVALNYVQRLSGIATRTAAFVELLGDRSVRLVDTRKTTPGLRALERYAVRVGGARNHRFNLADGILIKDNHIAAAGGVTAAVRAALGNAHHLLQVEVEVETLADAHEAVQAGARVIMLDNFPLARLQEAVRALRSRAEDLIIEASGDVNERTLVAIADAGVDVISSGGLIHQATFLDIALEVTLA